MTIKGDLHAHTTKSGDVTPARKGRSARSLIDLVASPEGPDVQVLSFTEHDKFSRKYLAEHLYALKKGVLLIPGVEFDASHDNYDHLHILAYFPVKGKRWGKEQFDPVHGLTISITRRRQVACAQICQLLIDKGVFYEESVRRRQGQNPAARISSKREIYQMLMDSKYTPREYLCSNMTEAERSVKEVYRVDVKIRKEGARSLVQIVHRLGGVTSLAHPFRLFRGGARVNARDVTDIVDEVGFDGIEVVYPYYSFPKFSDDESVAAVTHAYEIARRRNLLVTGGSDYHGDNARGKGAMIGATTLNEKHTLKLIERLGLERFLPKIQ